MHITLLELQLYWSNFDFGITPNLLRKERAGNWEAGDVQFVHK
jgi:hypothetical protein